MAQDSNVRPVRSDESYSREPAAGGRNNDPLAELARLIGQDDPFAAAGRPGAPSQGAPTQAHADPHAAPEWLNRSAPAPQQDHYDRGDADQHDAAAYDAQHQHEQHYEDTQYASDEYYDDGQTYADEGYAEAVPEKRRGGLTIVAAVVGLAVLGTAGVYGYRAFTGPATTSGEPPVIKAEQTPMKVVPPTPSNDAQVAKPYVPGADRGGERIVQREEQPVDPRSLAPRANPPAPPAAGGSVLPPLGAPAPQSAAAAGTEPKKVKTQVIRPDQQQAAAGPAVQSPARVAPTPAPAPAVATPTPPRPVPTTSVRAETGGYVVQVASQRSEADAHASFKALQQKYPSVLGTYQPMIRRADLGDKGVYYRAQVGPFAAEQAKELCSNLKSAGGQCVVQPN